MRSLLFPLRAPQWMKVTAALGLVSLFSFTALSWRWPWLPGRPGGMFFGILAGLLFINAGLYPWRRRLQARPLGTVQRWLHLHVYGSALGLGFVFLHIGFTLPSGVIGWLLLLLSIWTVGGGLAGVWLQRIGPLILARRVAVEPIYERIPEMTQRLAAEADLVAARAPEALGKAYAARIRPRLIEPKASLGSILGASPIEGEMLRTLSEVRALLAEGDRSKLGELEVIIRDKVALDTHFSVQRVLRSWLILHVPPAMLLLGFLAVHVIAVVLH